MKSKVKNEQGPALVTGSGTDGQLSHIERALHALVGDVRGLRSLLGQTGTEAGRGTSVASSAEPLVDLSNLSRREHEVVSALCAGRRVAQLSKALAISECTVRSHLRNVYRKLGVHSQVELLELLSASGGVNTQFGPPSGRWAEQALSHMSDAVLVTDAAGTIVYVNRAFESASGFSSTDALGNRPNLQKSGAQSQHFYRDLWGTIADGSRFEATIRNKRKSGTFYDCDMSIFPLRSQQTIDGYVAVERDLSLAASSWHDGSMALSDAGLSVGTLCHDLNNALTVAVGNLKYLQTDINGGGKGDIDLDAVTNALCGVERATSIIKDVLDLSRGSSSVVPVALDASIETAVRIVQLGCRKGISFDTDGVEPAMVDGRQARISRLLVNLLTNATKAFPEGQRDAEIRVRTMRRAEDMVVVEIIDNGVGIPKHLHERIFDPLFSTRKNDGGTGFGLFSCRSIAQDMGGTLVFDSEINVGTVFRLTLPLRS